MDLEHKNELAELRAHRHAAIEKLSLSKLRRKRSQGKGASPHLGGVFVKMVRVSRYG